MSKCRICNIEIKTLNTRRKICTSPECYKANMFYLNKRGLGHSNATILSMARSKFNIKKH